MEPESFLPFSIAMGRLSVGDRPMILNEFTSSLRLHSLRFLLPGILLVAVTAFGQYTQVYATSELWSLASSHDPSGNERLVFFNSDSTEVYFMDRSEVGPTQFALTQYTIKDALKAPYSLGLGIYYTGSSPRKIKGLRFSYGTP